jgi:hypothetical protein
MPLSQHLNNDPLEWLGPDDVPDYYTKVFTIADKYDFPSVRLAVVNTLRQELGGLSETTKERFKIIRSEYPNLPDVRVRPRCSPASRHSTAGLSANLDRQELRARE